MAHHHVLYNCSMPLAVVYVSFFSFLPIKFRHNFPKRQGGNYIFIAYTGTLVNVNDFSSSTKATEINTKRSQQVVEVIKTSAKHLVAHFSIALLRSQYCNFIAYVTLG